MLKTTMKKNAQSVSPLKENNNHSPVQYWDVPGKKMREID